MSHLLWKYFHNEEVDKFRQLLSNGNQNISYAGKGHAVGNAHSYGSLAGSPSGFATSPKVVTKHRKVSGNPNVLKGPNTSLGRAEVNSRDHAGLTILHRAASSSSENAIRFALALLEHPAIDLYVQDIENGWTALHRALYFGNITIARAIIEKDHRNPFTQPGSTGQKIPTSVIKVKDHEGNSPFDVYNATIARRSPQSISGAERDGSDDDTDDADSTHAVATDFQPIINGDEVFAWGSSRNHGLGFKDQDDRQHPEKITLHRPDHLLFRFYREYLESTQPESDTLRKSTSFPKTVLELPTLISNRPIIIQDVILSKLHSAILTTDPESNLYMCGFGPGGRLGTGDEVTRFSYIPIDDGPLAGKKVTNVALGQNHTLAVTSDGSLLSWGSNLYGQLGYSLPRPVLKDEEPICLSPRQIFGPLKREMIVGVAASALHSVAHTSTSLFTWGKNEGQLGLMDSDSRSLEVQPVPRKVAASLFKSPISMVSAINTATIVLLTNHTVCVFTNYGYNIVKFPLNEGFTNYHLKASAFTTQYDSSSHISYITAGGDTIAAISSRGDLFTLTVRNIPTGSTSTTNPTKIKESLTAPQRIWTLRKGNWDGIKSVGVTENGSVIVCTQAGAVWQRVKRANAKDSFTGVGSYSRKDFKFQRVPGLTKVAAVRSTTFGVYAAVRKDCDVTKTQICAIEQSLQQDVAPLLVFRDLEASKPVEDDEDTETPRFWAPAISADLFDPVTRAVLTSPDLEADVSRHILGQINETYDIEVATSTSDVRIPVHGFILGRSPVLRKLLDSFRRSGITSVPDILVIEPNHKPQISGLVIGGKIKRTITFQGLDFIALVNLVLYLYTDTVVDVWHFTRHYPPMAFRYRQVRVELMKTAAYLKLSKLETAVRLMTEPERCIDVDLGLAIRDPVFFDDRDAIVELDGSEVRVHSTLLCRRCPFFQGLFNGRAGGQWLAGRRQHDSDAVRIDLKHIQPEVFQLVLRYLYADVGTELFDDVVSADIDEFSDLVMDVMAVSNELMLDMLSQICQEVIGRFVTTRNVCHLLNAIAPCSITAFKDSALEYICLQLESMLENHLLNDLDEDLLLELDEIVRENQLNCLPFAKSGRADIVLHERYPFLTDDLHEERRRRLGEMIFRATHRDDDGRLSSSFRVQAGSLDDIMSASPGQDKSRKKSKAGRNAPFSPSIRPKDSTIDLMFNMDDDGDDNLSIESPKFPPTIPTIDFGLSREKDRSSPKMPLDDFELRSIPNEDATSLYSTTPGPGIQVRSESSVSASKKWSSPALPSSKLDMRDIMAQAASNRPSALSISLSAQKAKDEKDGKATPQKLSQKERKKQQAIQQSLHRTQSTPDTDIKPGSPWQVASRGPKISLKEVLKDPSSSPPAGPSKSIIPPISPTPHTTRRTASPDTRFSGQQRSASRGQPPTRPLMQPRESKSSPIVPHSKSYLTPTGKAEPSLQLSLSDIIGQQRREQEVIKEAVAKKSLQEIQEEQAFQEWWDQESKKAQEEEAARAKASVSGSGSGRGGKSGSGRGKNGRGRGRGRGDGQVRGRGKGQDKGSTTS